MDSAFNVKHVRPGLEDFLPLPFHSLSDRCNLTFTLIKLEEAETRKSVTRSGISGT